MAKCLNRHGDFGVPRWHLLPHVSSKHHWHSINRPITDTSVAKMPRRSGGARPSRPAMRPMTPPRRQASTQAAPPPPAPRHAAPPPAHSGGGGGMLAGLGGMVAQGMALGTGSALAHRAVDSVLGSRYPEPAQAQAAAQQIAATPDEPCANFAKTFADCMSDSNGELEACRYYFDKLQACKVPQAQEAGFAFS